MLLMQRLTPTGTMDPAQQKMMMIMPVMFTVMFVAAPAGLNLYWLASNVCSIVQQTVTMSLLKGREADDRPRPGEEEEVKDRAFTGKDVADAVRTAALTLGIKEADLRYFVLDSGGEGAVRRRAEPGPHRGAHGRSHRPQQPEAPRPTPSRPAAVPAVLEVASDGSRTETTRRTWTTTWRWRWLE